MSVRLMSQVWELELPDSEKLVLLALADAANDEGGCWPSIATVARKCSKGERTVQGCIKTLISKGHLTRHDRPGTSSYFTVHPRRACTPAEPAPPQRLRQTPAAAAPKPSGTVNSSVPSERPAAPALIDLKASIFGPGLAILTDAGVPANQARSMLGRWRKARGDPAVIDALSLVQSQAISDPIPFIEKVLENRHAGSSHRGGQSRTSSSEATFAALRELGALGPTVLS